MLCKNIVSALAVLTALPATSLAAIVPDIKARKEDAATTWDALGNSDTGLFANSLSLYVVGYPGYVSGAPGFFAECDIIVFADDSEYYQGCTTFDGESTVQATTNSTVGSTLLQINSFIVTHTFTNSAGKNVTATGTYSPGYGLTGEQNLRFSMAVKV